MILCQGNKSDYQHKPYVLKNIYTLITLVIILIRGTNFITDDGNGITRKSAIC